MSIISPSFWCAYDKPVDVFPKSIPTTIPVCFGVFFLHSEELLALADSIISFPSLVTSRSALQKSAKSVFVLCLICYWRCVSYSALTHCMCNAQGILTFKDCAKGKEKSLR